MLERFLDKTSFSSQEDFMKNFKVKVPDCFNFGYDVVDEWARIVPEKKALLWTNDQGKRIDFTESIKTKSSYSPSRSTGTGRVQVKGYYRKDGTYVRPHTRKSPTKRK